MNWSLALNALLLISVLAVLFRTLKKREAMVVTGEEKRPILNAQSSLSDDIISVRKITNSESLEEDGTEFSLNADPRGVMNDNNVSSVESNANQTSETPCPDKTLMIFLLAKPQRQLAGYEMLQTLLASGLRFGEGQIFHYHQNNNGQGPILCSVAAATANGTFDLQNIGAFNAKGLCLFMHLSGNPGLDTERLDKMVETANQLAEGLDTFLLDDQRKPFTNETKLRYRQQLN